MSDAPNTVFLRLEGPLQAWADNSKAVIRRTMEAPTKSGVLGLICCAMGLSRQEACERLPVLNTLVMGARIDRAGARWWDYHTVAARYGILTAEGKVKKTASTSEYETLITRREYLCDASFLVAIQGDTELIETVVEALQDPKWPPFLGRKACPPSVPLLVTRERGDGMREAATGSFDSIMSALSSREWSPRYESHLPRDEKRKRLNTIACDCLVEWRASAQELIAPAEAQVWYDAPVSFDPPVHEARLIVRDHVTVKVGDPTQQHTPPPARPRAAYSSHAWTDKLRPARLERDQSLCVFCKQQASQVHHASYRHAGGDESVEHELRSLCRLCHDAVTMIEYGLGMGLDRIDPCEPRWRDQIICKRQEIIEFRSLETRRRRLQPQEVE